MNEAGKRAVHRAAPHPALVVAPLALLAWPAFPPLEWHVLAWLALAPLMLAIQTLPGRLRTWFFAGWWYGVVYYALQFAWLRRPLLEIAAVPPLSFLVFVVALVGALALVPAAAIGLARWGWAHWGASPLWSLPVLLAAGDALLGVFPFGGVAWGSLAGTQPQTVAARLLAPLVGGPGLVLVLGLVNGGWAAGLGGLALAPAWRRAGAPPRSRLRARARALATVLACALVTGVAAWPAPAVQEPRVAPGHAGAGSFTALLVPGDITLPQMMAWYDTPETLRYYLVKTLAALTPPKPTAGEAPAPPELAVWPESAVSGEVARGHILPELSQVATLVDTDLLLGSGTKALGHEYNSVYLVTGGRFDFQRYDKRQLVPFGEYVPTGFRWFFGRKITAGEQDYTPGSAPPVVAWRERRLGLAICFESVLPEHLRRAVRAGAQAIVAVANDEWLTGPARRQHLLLSALRGLEVGRDVVFVSNGGWSALLRGGRALALHDWRSPPFRVRVHLSGGLTPWVRWGYRLLAALCAAVVSLGLLIER